MLLALTGKDDDSEYEDGPFFLASSSAWGACAKWVTDTLPEEDFPTLTELAQTGECDGTDALAVEVGGVVDVAGKPDGVAATLEALLDLLGMGDADETAAIVDEDDVPDDVEADTDA